MTDARRSPSPPGAARIAVRTRPLLDVFDLAVRFVAVHGWAYARIAALVLPPGVALTWLASTWGTWWLGWAVGAFAATIAQTPFTIYASRVVFEDEVRVRSVLAASLRQLPKMVLARSVHYACVALGALLFLVPAGWVGATMLYLGEALALERSGVIGAMSRTQRLAAAAFGDTMLGLLLLVVLHASAALLGDVAGRSLLEGLLQSAAPASGFSSGGSLLAAIGFWAFVPYAATVKFLLYLNVRTRAEGWDVQTRFAALARRAEADAEAREAAE